MAGQLFIFMLLLNVILADYALIYDAIQTLHNIVNDIKPSPLTKKDVPLILGIIIFCSIALFVIILGICVFSIKAV